LQELLNLTIFKNKVMWRNLQLLNLVWQFEASKSIHLINMGKISKQIGVMRKICNWFKCMNWGKVIHTFCHYFTTRKTNDRLWIHVCIVWVSCKHWAQSWIMVEQCLFHVCKHWA
jgi:hypothetical protein